MSESGKVDRAPAVTTAGHRVAVIDLGSNTARLIALSAIPGFSFRLEDEIREVVRLRQGMTEEGLSDAAVARGLSTLRLFKRFCDSTPKPTWCWPRPRVPCAMAPSSTSVAVAPNSARSRMAASNVGFHGPWAPWH